MSDTPNDLPHDGPCPECGHHEVVAVSVQEERIEYNDVGELQRIQPWGTQVTLWEACAMCETVLFRDDDHDVRLHPPDGG